MSGDKYTQLEQDFQAFVNGLVDLMNFCEEKETTCSLGDAVFCQEGINAAIQILQFIVTQLHEPSPNLLQNIQTLLKCFQDLKCTWDSVHFTISASQPMTVCEASQVMQSGNPGRPLSYLNAENIIFLLQHNFKFCQIAEMYLIHRSTLWRRLKNSGILLDKYTNISDDELMAIMENIYQNHPNTGVTMMMGHLRALNINVKQKKVCELLRAIDPARSAERWGLVAQRRTYSVQGPNALWHIDGHHKLIKWKFVTHGGIDGFSRLIIYLHCSNNNSAGTVLKLFLEAVEQFSLPSRVRGDKGSENFEVSSFMEQSRGENQGSFIAGQSIHNCRIERLWCDVFYSVIQEFYSLFYQLENQELLNIDNESDIFCLHYVFLPRINAALKSFQNAYNSHSIRTERNWSPYQMWINGMISMERNGLANFAAIPHDDSVDLSTFGVDPNNSNIDTNDEDVQLEGNNTFVVSNDIIQSLIAQVDPLGTSDDMGIDLFCRAKNIVSSFVS